MKVLITGAHGQVGRSLLATVPEAVTAIGLSHAELDIGDAAAVHRVIAAQRPQVILNAAAYTAVDRAETDSESARRVNALGPRHLAEAAAAQGARLLHLSTDFVFDGRSSTPYTPEAPTAPLGAYGRSKLEGEQAVRALLPQASVVLRTAWVYAAQGRNFLLTMLRLMAEQHQVRVVCDQIGTPTAASSVAEVLWALTARPEISGVHHFTDAGTASWYDFAMAICEEATRLGLLPPGVTVTPIRSAEYPSAARRPAYSVLDCSTLLAALPVPQRHWRDTLRETLRSLQSPSC